MRRKQLMLILLATVLASCVTVKEPMLVNKDTYIMSTSSRFTSNAKSLTATLKSASAFCAAKGLNMSIQSSEMSFQPFNGVSRENNLIFKCVPANISPSESHEPSISSDKI